MATENPYNGTFDPYAQNITVVAPDGVNSMVLPLQTVLDLQTMSAQTGIMFGVQIGMVTILMLVLLMITKPTKYRSAIFVLNFLALVLILIRNILECLQMTGPFYNYYNWVAAYYVNVAGAKRVSATSECLSFVIDLAIEMSLMMQVRIVCCTLSTIWRAAITLTSVLVVLMACGVRFTLTVLNIKYNIAIVGQTTDEQWDMLNHYASVSNICIMCSIIFFSLIFCVKLAHAIRQRRKMGIKQFGPMQIIFVMGCQTLIIPAIFGILSYEVLKNQQVNSFMPVVVATFLPLSAMWASTNTKTGNNIAAPCQAHGQGNFVAGPSMCGAIAGPPAPIEKDRLTTTFGTDFETLVTNGTRGSSYSSNPKEPGTHITARASRDSIDMELEKMGRAINVKRTVSVNSRQEA